MPQYLAKRPDGIVLRDGTKLAVGDVIPDFDTWGEVVQRAHINLGWVERVADPPKAAQVVAEVAEPDEALPPLQAEEDLDQDSPPFTPAVEPEPEPEPLQCASCGQKFETPKALRKHARSHQ